MKYKNLVFEDMELNEVSVNLQIQSTNEMIEITDNIRKEKGYKDLVGTADDNEVYYNFYLDCHQEDRKIKIFAVCHHGEHDDYAEYELPITEEERENILFQLIKELVKEID